jgi:hypothetical protein
MLKPILRLRTDMTTYFIIQAKLKYTQMVLVL